MSESIRGNSAARVEWRYWWIVFFAVFAIVLATAAGFVFGPYRLETGDFAANALNIIRAKSFHEIYGNYSRWQFNHPGPFFFYVYAFGEMVLVDLLHLVPSPHQAHVFVGIILQSGFIASSVAISLFLVRDKRILLAWILVACLGAGIGYIAVSSIWAPHVLFGPYLLLLISSAALSLGWFRFLPVCVFCVCVLCHGHIAQPVLTFPVFLAAILSFAWVAKTRQVIDPAWTSGRKRAGGFAASFVIVGIFLIPIIIDLTRCPNCNAVRVLTYMKSNHGQTPNFNQAMNYVASYFIFDRKPEWLDTARGVKLGSLKVLFELLMVAAALVLPTKWLLNLKTSRVELQRLALFCILALAFSTLWALRITGPLYEFNSFFVYSIVGLLGLLVVYCLVARLSRPVLLVFSLLWIATAFFIVPRYNANFEVFSKHSTMLGGSEPVHLEKPGSRIIINQIDGQDWGINTGLAVRLTRSNVPYFVPNDWTYVFGWGTGYTEELLRNKNNAMEIWTAKVDHLPYEFTESDYCRINDDSPILDTRGKIEKFNPLKAKCEIAAAPSARPGKPDEWEWLSANMIALQFKSKSASKPVDLSFEVFPYLGNGKIKSQHVGVLVNGEEIAGEEVSGTGVVHVSVAPTLWNRSPITTVVLKLDGKQSPKELGLSGDDRRLSIGLLGVGVRYAQ